VPLGEVQRLSFSLCTLPYFGPSFHFTSVKMSPMREMEETKSPATVGEDALVAELRNNGEAVVTDQVGNEADVADMWRMGKVQQMQVRRSSQHEHGCAC
jgi:hypothetical protein